MGFRTGAYVKVWGIKSISDTATELRVSVSRKNKQTGEYEQEFSGFISCVGTVCARRAASLHEGDRIKLGDVDVTNRYNKEKETTYVNYKVFSFDLADEQSSKPKPAVDDGEIDNDLPF